MKKIIILVISIILMFFFFCFYLQFSNNKYEDNLKTEIKKNYNIKNEIKYLNKSNLYYIILTTKNLIVLDDVYQEVFIEDINKIKLLNKDYDIVYRLKKVMFETKKIFDSKVVYEYYDIYTNELIDTIQVGG